MNTCWYQDGDLNTKFIHTSSTVTRKVNRISSLEDASRVQVTNKAQMANMIDQKRRLPSCKGENPNGTCFPSQNFQITRPLIRADARVI